MTALLHLQIISRIDPALLPSSQAKIEAAFSAFDEFADPAPLVQSFAGIEHKLTPSKFLHWMRQTARDKRQRIVLPEATDHRVIMAAAQAQRKGFAQIILLGNEDQVLQVRSDTTWHVAVKVPQKAPCCDVVGAANAWPHMAASLRVQ